MASAPHVSRRFEFGGARGFGKDNFNRTTSTVKEGVYSCLVREEKKPSLNSRVIPQADRIAEVSWALGSSSRWWFALIPGCHVVLRARGDIRALANDHETGALPCTRTLTFRPDARSLSSASKDQRCR
jgi:hypothetical protein